MEHFFWIVSRPKMGFADTILLGPWSIGAEKFVRPENLKKTRNNCIEASFGEHCHTWLSGGITLALNSIVIVMRMSPSRFQGQVLQ